MNRSNIDPRFGGTEDYQKQLLERSFAMQAQAHQMRVKSELLTQAVMQIETSKKTLRVLNEALEREVAFRKQTEDEMRKMFNRDSLTGLPNRALFNERMELALDLALRNGQKLAVLYIDLDGFKAVNDSLGHEAGDYLLTEIARRLKAAVRKSDTAARMGGDEFVLVLNGIKETGDIEPTVRKIFADLKRPVVFGNQSLQIGASIGVSVYPDHGTDPNTLIGLADKAMYGIKKSGKNAYAFHRPA